MGSEKGAELLASHEIDFAASDVSSSDLGNPQLQANFRQIPTVLGAVVVIYNLPDVTLGLKFTPGVLADIYLGKIKRWNDPEIVKSNKGVNPPNSDIVVVHRSDGSGTTYALSDYLSKISPEWQNSVGRGTSLSWPMGEGAQANDGVAAKVQSTPNSIGYVGLVYAIQHQLTTGWCATAQASLFAPIWIALPWPRKAQVPSPRLHLQSPIPRPAAHIQ